MSRINPAVKPPHRIAVIAGDGIGREVVPEGLRVLEAVSRRFGIALQFDHFNWCSEHYQACLLYTSPSPRD